MRGSRSIGLLVLTILLIMFSQAVADDDFMCGSYIITIGDRSYDVLRRCGKPSNVESWEEVRSRREPGFFQLEPEKKIQLGPRLVQELVTIEEWEYNPGPNRFIRYLRFENGRLMRITTGDYGYN